MGNCSQPLTQEDNELNFSKTMQGMHLTVKIWSKKSNELFNYESKNYKELKYELWKQESLPLQLRNMFWKSEKDGFMLFNPLCVSSDQEGSFHSKWININSLESTRGLFIQPNDVYKLGNTILKVKEIFFSEKQQFKLIDSIDLIYKQSTNSQSRSSRRVGSTRNSQFKGVQKQNNIIVSSAEESSDDEEGEGEQHEGVKCYSNQLVPMTTTMTMTTRGSKQSLHHQQSDTENGSRQCRICLACDDEQDQNRNNFVSICGCQGSMKWVHIRCLQTWLVSKQQKIEDFSSKNASLFNHSILICELCKKKFPLKIRINGSQELVLRTNPIENENPSLKKEEQGENMIEQTKQQQDKTIENNYIVFELSNNSTKSLNGLMILDLKRVEGNLSRVFSLGRQNLCDVKMNDITLSRFHAEIQVDFENHRVSLRDTNSKFGTLLKLRKELVVNRNLHGLQIQINNVCLEFSDSQHDFTPKIPSSFSKILSYCYQSGSQITMDQEIQISDTPLNQPNKKPPLIQYLQDEDDEDEEEDEEEKEEEDEEEEEEKEEEDEEEEEEGGNDNQQYQRISLIQ